LRYKNTRIHLLWIAVPLLVAGANAAHGAIIYPQIGVGGGYETVVTIANPTSTDWFGRLRCQQGAHVQFPILLKANGQHFSEFTQWKVGAGRTLQLTITGDDTLRAGFLRIERVNGPAESEIATSVFYRLRDTAGVSRELIASYPGQPSTSAIFAVEKGASQDTGIAFVARELPYSTNPISISFTLLGQDGATIQKVEQMYSGHTALMLGQLFDKLPPQFLGSVVVDSSIELCLLVLRLEIFEGNIQLTGSVPVSGVPSRSGLRLMQFRPIDAEYSKALDRVIAIAGNPYSVHIYDAEANTSQTISLPELPMSLSLSLDGKQAIVGFSSSFSLINLVDRNIVKTVPTAFNCYDVVLTDAGYVYVFPEGDQWVESYRVRLSDGEATLLDHMTRYRARGRLHPGGKRVYRVTESQMTSFNVETEEVRNGGDSWASDLWFSEDGLRIFLSNGHVVRSSDLASEDMQPNGTFNEMISSAYHSASTGTVVWLPNSFHWAREPWRRDAMHVVNYADLQPRKTIELPDYPAPTSVRSRGEYVFSNAAGTKLILIVRADAGSGVLSDFSVMLLDTSSLAN